MAGSSQSGTTMVPSCQRVKLWANGWGWIVRSHDPIRSLDQPGPERWAALPLDSQRKPFETGRFSLKFRPIHHRLADRVRTHIFLCMLAYYVEWYTRESWRDLMLADSDQEAKATRDRDASTDGRFRQPATHRIGHAGTRHAPCLVSLIYQGIIMANIHYPITDLLDAADFISHGGLARTPPHNPALAE